MNGSRFVTTAGDGGIGSMSVYVRAVDAAPNNKFQLAIYADNAGRVSTYAVSWWRVVAPTTAASWAWAEQARPSMTLQTCVGANSQYRLMVRLTKVG